MRKTTVFVVGSIAGRPERYGLLCPGPSQRSLGPHQPQSRKAAPLGMGMSCRLAAVKLIAFILNPGHWVVAFRAHAYSLLAQDHQLNWPGKARA